MKRKFIWIFSSVIVLILFFSINNQTEGIGSEAMLKPAKYHELKITKIGNEWKVVLSEDATKKKVKAKRNDRITWYADGTDAYLEFMDDNLFGKYKDKVKDGKFLTIKIKDDAELGIHKYSVFCLADLEFATGDSPPEIDITD